jgi:AcrR family transcriptional regulator
LQPKSKTTRAKRVRRSTEEIVDRIIDAAVEEFEAKGFSGATTAAIARRAGVVEALLFTNFGSKAQLFQQAIFKPLDRHLHQFQTAHQIDLANPEERREGTRQYISALQKFISEHAGMFTSLIFAETYKLPEIKGVARVKGLDHYFAMMARIAESDYFSGRPPMDPKLLARISFATILFCTVFKDWLFPEGTDEEEIRSAVAAFVLDGINANAAAV